MRHTTYKLVIWPVICQGIKCHIRAQQHKGDFESQITAYNLIWGLDNMMHTKYTSYINHSYHNISPICFISDTLMSNTDQHCWFQFRACFINSWVSSFMHLNTAVHPSVTPRSLHKPTEVSQKVSNHTHGHWRYRGVAKARSHKYAQ